MRVAGELSPLLGASGPVVKKSNKMITDCVSGDKIGCLKEVGQMTGTQDA